MGAFVEKSAQRNQFWSACVRYKFYFTRSSNPILSHFPKMSHIWKDLCMAPRI